MAAGVYDIVTKRGVDLSLPIRFKADGVVLNLTGKTFIFRARWRDQILRMQTGVDAGLTMPTPASGEILLVLTDTETRALPIGRSMEYEIEVREPSGAQDVWLEGFLDVSEGINDDA